MIFLLLSASCGGLSTGTSSSEGTPIDSPEEATQTATDTALQVTTDAVSGATSVGVSGANASVSQMAIRGLVQNLSIPISEEFEEDAPCETGSGSMSGSVTGTIEGETDDYDNFTITAADMQMTMTGIMTDCAFEDNSETEFDESSLTMSGEIEGSGALSGDVSGIQMSMEMDGAITFEADGCDGGGSLTMAMNGGGEADYPDEGEEPNFDCTVTGSVSGTACGTTIDCTISGDCDNPTQTGTGC